MRDAVLPETDVIKTARERARERGVDFDGAKHRARAVIDFVDARGWTSMGRSAGGTGWKSGTGMQSLRPSRSARKRCSKEARALIMSFDACWSGLASSSRRSSDDAEGRYRGRRWSLSKRSDATSKPGGHCGN